MGPLRSKSAIPIEDPLNQQKIREETQVELSLYGSVRLRVRHLTSGSSQWEDNGSRLGLESWYATTQNSGVIGRVELGFNLLEELGLDGTVAEPDQELGQTVFPRLLYAGFQWGHDLVLFGKNWSSYYQVAQFTDLFDSVGGEASGAYNANTDGGKSGTGRADRALQTRLHFPNPFTPSKEVKWDVNAQIQAGESIPGISDASYEIGLGVSSVLDITEHAAVGLAFNLSPIDIDAIPLEDRKGLDGDLSTLLLGAMWQNDVWHIAVTVSESRNTHTTDQGVYFAGTGVEVYGHARIFPSTFLVAGLNHVEPHSDQDQAGDYQLGYGVVGLRYSSKRYSSVIYVESRLDYGGKQNGDRFSDQIILGLRYSF